MWAGAAVGAQILHNFCTDSATDVAHTQKTICFWLDILNPNERASELYCQCHRMRHRMRRCVRHCVRHCIACVIACVIAVAILVQGNL